MEITYGTDPEFFLQDTETGKFVSAYGKFPGTKYEPFPLTDGAVQVDGTALEFNINPVDNWYDFNNNIESVLSEIDVMIKDVSNRLIPIFTPVVRYDKDYFKSLSMEEKILGCDPDFNIRGHMNEIPLFLQETATRTGAGHIHIGWLDDKPEDELAHFEDCRAVSEYFVHNKLFLPRSHDQSQRLSYYGNNGAFRPKPYGVELRAPDNVWVASKLSRKKMFENVKTTFERFLVSVGA